jgi:xylulokinase
MTAELVIGVDLGTTALKAGLFELDGTLLALAEAAYPIDRPQPDRAEQDPDDWLAALDSALDSLGGRGVAALGICGQVNTHVFVGDDGAPLRPAILWEDQRSGGSSLVGRAEWVQREEPDVWQATRWILSPKDFVTSRICSLRAPATDALTSFDLVDEAGAYDPALLASVDGLAERLPRIERFEAAIGELGTIRVVTGTMDAWGNLYGSGVVDHGGAMEVAGTSEILGVLSRDHLPVEGVVTFAPVDGLHLHAGPTQAGGAALAWFAALVGLSIGEVVDAAAAAPPGAGGLIFLPHLAGERAPLWDADARGAFIGLSSGHSVADLSRAVLEGVAYSARHLLEELEQAAGVEAEALNASGGGSQSDLWCQIKADVLARPIARVAVRHSGCLGAALMAAAGARLVPSVREAARIAVRIERVFEPRPGGNAPYDELYAVYRELYRALQPTHAILADLRRGPNVVPTS